MKSIQNALLAYSAGKTILAAGTFVVLFNVATGLVPTWPPLAQGFVAILIICILLPLLDGAWDYIEDALRSMNGQSPALPKSTRTMFFVLGFLGVAGSMFLSILSASMISDVVVDDKSGIAAEMEGAKAQGDAAYLQLLASAERNVRRAEKQLQAAQENESKAEKQAVSAIGGEFARLWMSGNAWVKSAPETSANRRKVQKAVQAAQDKTADAQKALAQAQAAYNDVTTTGRAENMKATEDIIKAHDIVLKKWLDELRTTTVFFIRVDLVAGTACLFLLFTLFKVKAIPDDRTLMEVFTKAIRLTADAFVYALGVSVDAAERQAKNAGFVAHPLPGISPAPVVPPLTYTPSVSMFTPPVIASPEVAPAPVSIPPVFTPPVAGGRKVKYSPGEKARLIQLRDNIKKYKRQGILSEKKAATLAKWENEKEAIVNAAKNRKA